MNAQQIRNAYLKFFEDRGHAVIAEALPQFDQEDRGERTGLAGSGGLGVHLEIRGEKKSRGSVMQAPRQRVCKRT